MKHLIIILALALSACATNDGLVKKDVELVNTPVPFCPAPPEFKLVKEYGTEFIKDNTPPGEVAKAYEYEVAYQKGRADILQAVSDFYKQHSNDLEGFQKKLQEMIDTTNSKLKTGSILQAPSKQP